MGHGGGGEELVSYVFSSCALCNIDKGKEEKEGNSTKANFANMKEKLQPEIQAWWPKGGRREEICISPQEREGEGSIQGSEEKKIENFPNVET